MFGDFSGLIGKSVRVFEGPTTFIGKDELRLVTEGQIVGVYMTETDLSHSLVRILVEKEKDKKLAVFSFDDGHFSFIVF